MELVGRPSLRHAILGLGASRRGRWGEKGRQKEGLKFSGAAQGIKSGQSSARTFNHSLPKKILKKVALDVHPSECTIDLCA